MKKNMIALAALSTLLCTALTGCSINVTDDTVSQAANIAASVLDSADISVNDQNVDVSVDSNGDINVNITQAPAAETQTTAPAVATEAPAVQTTESTPAGLSEAEMKNISKQLITEYMDLYDGLGAGCVEIDETQLSEVRAQWPYLMVLDPKLQSVADVEQVLSKTLIHEAYTEMHAMVLEGEMPLFLPINDNLYVRQAGRGGAYSDTWNWDDLQFSNVTTEGFTVTGTYTHMGAATMTQSFNILNTPEGYRISWVGGIIYE